MSTLEQTVGLFLQHIHKRGMCLQAGGALGAYPLELARHFKNVVTVEANAGNFSALRNATSGSDNIVRVHAGLWNEPGRAGTKPLRNGTSYDSLTNYIVPGDTTELIRIDDLELKPDLIWLDIEGSEYKALSGASKTLETCEAVIIEEGKDLERNVGDKPWAARSLLLELGFLPVLRLHLDTLFLKNGEQTDSL